MTLYTLALVGVVVVRMRIPLVFCTHLYKDFKNGLFIILCYVQ